MSVDEYGQFRSDDSPPRRRLLSRLSVFVIGCGLGLASGVVLTAAVLQGGSGRSLVWPLAPIAVGDAAKAATAPKPATRVQAAIRPEMAARLQTIAAAPVIRVGVFGDSMADGLWAGLYRNLQSDQRFRFVRFSKPSTGLTRLDYLDVPAVTEAQLAAQPMDVAVVLFGANDQQGIYTDTHKVVPYGGDQWAGVYAAHMQKLLDVFKARGIPVYWVGLPRMERAGFDKGAMAINEIDAETASLNGVSFIPTAARTADPAGAYAAYLPNPATGRPELMRAKDGIHMTMAGYLRLAAPVSERLLADLPKPVAGAAVTAGGRTSPSSKAAR
jgi:hypothetical protein